MTDEPPIEVEPDEPPHMPERIEVPPQAPPPDEGNGVPSGPQPEPTIG